MQKIITFITSYSLVVSLLYLFGFWSSFNVNVLEYIALTDVIKNALYPLIYSSVFIVLGLTIGSVITAPLNKALPPGGGQHLPEAKYVRWVFRLIALFLFALALHIIFFEVGNTRWFKVALLVNIPILVMVGNASFVSNYINNKQLRIFIVNILCVTLLFSFGWGALHAEEVKSSEQTIKINGEKYNQSYVGWAGDFLFLWDNSKNTLVVKPKSAIKSIEFSMPVQTAILDFSSSEEKPNK